MKYEQGIAAWELVYSYKGWENLLFDQSGDFMKQNTDFSKWKKKATPQTLYHKLKPTIVDQEKKCYHMRILNDHFFYLKNVNLPVSIEEKAKFL